MKLLDLLVGDVLHDVVDGRRVEAPLTSDGPAPGPAPAQLEGRYEACCACPGDAEQRGDFHRGSPSQRGNRGCKGYVLAENDPDQIVVPDVLQLRALGSLAGELVRRDGHRGLQ